MVIKRKREGVRERETERDGEREGERKAERGRGRELANGRDFWIRRRE